MKDKLVPDENKHYCNKCVNGYFADFDDTGWHNLCGAGRCYLCHRDGTKCPDFKEGKPPEGKAPM